MNFEGWAIKVVFCAEDYVKNLGNKEKDGWEGALKVSFDRLVFECGFVPRSGDWISCGGHFDGVYVKDVAFYPEPKYEVPEILFFVTEKEPTN